MDGNEEIEKESSGIQIQSKVDGNEDKEKKLKRKSKSRAVTVSADERPIDLGGPTLEDLVTALSRCKL